MLVGETVMPIDVKKAVGLARQYLSDIMQVQASEVLLEEVELSADGRYWLVTLSYPAPAPTPILVLTGRGDRNFRVVKLLAETGDFESIKIRSLASA
jgi:hypothetical protein